MSLKGLQLEITRVEQPSLCVTSRTSDFHLEFSGSQLHLPPCRLDYQCTDSKTAFVGIPSTFLVTLTNRRTQPLTDAIVSVTIEADRKSEFRSAAFPPVDPGRSCMFSVPQFTCTISGLVTIHALAEYKFEGARQKTKAREIYGYEFPLNVFSHLRAAPCPAVEFVVENLRLQKPIMNVRAEIGWATVEIARFLDQGESASGFALLVKPIQTLSIRWDMAPWQNCAQTVPIGENMENTGTHISIRLAGLAPTIQCLKPFSAKITVANHARMAFSGEMTLRTGPVALFGLNCLQFNNLEPGKEEELVGWFVALEQGKVQFPPFQVAIKEGPQFEVDAADGVFVIGSDL
jgi:hypothetical protein